MSSTKAVRVLLDLTDIVGFEPSKDVIKRGGYRGKDEFVRELSNRVEHQFTKHHASAPLNATVKKETEIHVQV